MNPVFFELAGFNDDRKPSSSSQEWILTQTLTAAPTPHASGTVIQASDKIPMSTHWYRAGSVTNAFLIFEKLNQIEGIFRFLPTSMEGNVFTGVCHSVHNRPHDYSVTAQPCYSAVGTRPTGMLSCYLFVYSSSCRMQENFGRFMIRNHTL